MELKSQVQALVAVGAAVSANCQPCLQINSAKALNDGISEQEIAEAIEKGKRVRFISEQARSASGCQPVNARSFGPCS